jgi:hypothetical protein
MQDGTHTILLTLFKENNYVKYHNILTFVFANQIQ